jgi:RNA polymerase sigma-70 factor, ECF subfamily
MSTLLPAMAEARQRFLELVADVRPALHRYCARMTGSVFDGEDVVQDTLAKAYYALSEMEAPPKLEPWLFRIAHNTAMDFVRRYEHKNVELVADAPETAHVEEHDVDGTLVEAALAVFVALPPTQRSALALTDVLGHSLQQTAETMGTTVAAVKAALVRARAHVAAAQVQPPPDPVSAEDQQSLRRYADLFNARNWDGLRALFGEESRLDLVSRWQRRGPSAAHYFTRYAEITREEPLRAEPGRVDGRPAIAVFRPGADRPAYFVEVQWDGGRIALIRDFHHVPYIAQGARFTAD